MSELKSSYLWQTSEKIIGFNTVSSESNLNCAEYISNHLQDFGFNVHLTQEPGAKAQIVAWIGPPEKNGLILSGHMDVVPFADQPGWTKDALKLTLETEKLYGRGTTDMKLFITQCLEAFKSTDLKKLKKPIVCLFTCDEEVGCLGAKNLSPHLKSILGEMPLPDKALIGEPTEFKIFNAHKGVVIFEVILKGSGGHRSRPDLGKNAILMAEKVLLTVNQLNALYQNEVQDTHKKLFPDFPYNYISVAQIDGGLAANMIPEECRIILSYRALPGEPAHRLLNEFRNIVSKQGLEEIEIHEKTTVPPLSPKKNIELEKSLQALTQNRIEATNFATDASYFSQEDIACFICGGGTLSMAHQPDEFMTLNDFLKGPQFIKELLQQTVF